MSEHRFKTSKDTKKKLRRKYQVEIGDRLRNLREQRGLNQREIAAILGFDTQGAYGKIETGDVSLKADDCIALADLFGVSCDYILRGVEHENIEVWKETGLADRSITFLKAHKRYNLDTIFQNGYFWHMIENIEMMIDYINDPEQAERRWDVNSFLVHKGLERLLSELRTEAIEWISFEERERVESIRRAREAATAHEHEEEAEFLEFLEENDL